MLDLVSGVRKFSQETYPKQKELFNSLAKGQKPHTLFITCSDSRIDPNLITNTLPGELFVLRNAGNLVPQYKENSLAEACAIEYAVEVLRVKNILVCGHAHCGAMAALSGMVDATGLPATSKWIGYGKLPARDKEASDQAFFEQCIFDNVLYQLENVKSHPSVQKALLEEKIGLYGWVYHFEKGLMDMYNKKEGKWVSSESLDTNACNPIDYDLGR